MDAHDSNGEESGFEMTVGPGAVRDGDSCTSEDVETRYPAGNSSAAGTVANVVNTIVGAGVIGLPFAVAQSGLWAGIFMMCLAAAMSYKANTMLISAGEKVGRLNYEELMAESFGKAGIYVFCLFAGVVAFGSMVAYLIIVGDTIPLIFQASGVTTGAFADRNSVIAICGIFFILPVSLLKDLSNLSYTSSISVGADFLLIIIVLVTASGEASDIDRSEVGTFIRPTIFAGFGAISFAFVCQQSSFLMYRSMSKGGVDRWACVTRWSLFIALAMGMSLALGGYLNFAKTTQGNILNNFSTDHKGANVARAFLAVTMVLTYPVEMYVARYVLNSAVFENLLGMGPMSSARHYLTTIFIWTLTMIVGFSTKNLGSVLEIFGALGAIAIGYVLPPLLHVKANELELQQAMGTWRKDSSEYEPALTERLRGLRNFFVPISMVIFGSLAMVAGVATAVVGELSHTKA